MHATIAIWRDGGIGNGPVNVLANSKLLARYSVVTDIGNPYLRVISSFVEWREVSDIRWKVLTRIS